ncbi:hypothetical protein MKW94_008171 [Papaver nudicaule]|uniref:Uncharacterized protein n=1 Tax=Papaver nudicaule TaxID=74823 RepID=A0AA41RJL9_PAPNU|nr:hypothetical protein [Papaver nudicaule]
MMKKFSQFLTVRRPSELLLSGKVSNPHGALLSRSFVSQAVARPNSASDGDSGKVFVDYTIFKGKGALNMSPIPPKFSQLQSGCMKVDRKGAMMLNFFPAVGPKKYDWQKKQGFALSVTEMGSLISLGPSESAEFFHDPSMQSSNAGQVRKKLSVQPLGNGGGFSFSLNVNNSVSKTSDQIYVPVSKAEFEVMRSSFNYILPRIMGWDRLFNPQLPASVNMNPEPEMEPEMEPGMLLSPDPEWDR